MSKLDEQKDAFKEEFNSNIFESMIASAYSIALNNSEMLLDRARLEMVYPAICRAVRAQAELTN